MSRVIVVGMLILLMVGCSEKQKEADRLAADLKAQQAQKIDPARDTLTNTDAQLEHDSTPPPVTQTTDSAMGQIDSSSQPQGGEISQSQPTEDNVPAESAKVLEESAEPEQTDQQATQGNSNVEPIMPPRPVDDGYVVQIASTTDPAEAKDISARFAGYGYPAFPQAAQINGAVWYRVRVGPYATSAEATAVLNELVEKYQVQGWVAKHN